MRYAPAVTSHHEPLVIGEFANRTSRSLWPLGWEALDMRQRLPDHKGQGVWRRCGQHQPLVRGCNAPEPCVRLRCLYEKVATKSQWENWTGFFLILDGGFRIMAIISGMETIMGGPNSGRRRPVQYGNVEQFPALDLRILRRAGLMRPGECTYTRLTWRNQASSASSVRAFVDLSDDRHASIRLRGDDIDQDIAIVVVPSGFGGVRYHMLCPIAGRLCEVLYLVDGTFGSRQAHRLTYASQSEDELGRARRRYGKLCRRLKGDMLYAKPRGSNRYERVTQRKEAEREARSLYRDRLARAMSPSGERRR